MTVARFLTTLQYPDEKTRQFVQDVQEYPEIGKLNLWSWLRVALRQVDCPCCIGHAVKPEGCRYCAQTGKVEYHLVTHPMNVYQEALKIQGKQKPIEVEQNER